MLAFVFPGQGSQAAGMGRDLAATWSVAAQTFQSADEALGFELSRLMFEGPEAELTLTANAQPAILAASVAALRVLAERGIRPALVAGHSLGEYSALVAAGSLGLAEALRLVRARGLYMQDAVPVGRGAMAAVMGLESDVVERICLEAGRGGGIVAAANYNAPGQTVISGDAAAVDRAVEAARRTGARRAVRLTVSAPFHCALMQPAADRLALDLERTPFADLEVPLVANVSAMALRGGAEAREALRLQVTAPVRWEQSVRRLKQMGATRVLEVGPGRVLAGLIRRIEPDLPCEPAGDTASIQALDERAA